MNLKNLHINLEAGIDLVSMDTNGFSDPYIKFSLFTEGEKKPIKKMKSKVQKKTLNPIWNEEFVFENVNMSSDTLQIQCFDWDRFSKDDSMGLINLKLIEWMDVLMAGDQLCQEFELEDVKKGKIKMTLILRDVPQYFVRIGGGADGHFRWVVSCGKENENKTWHHGFEVKVIVTEDGFVYGGCTDDYKHVKASKSITGFFDKMERNWDLNFCCYNNEKYITSQKFTGSFDPQWKSFRGQAKVTHKAAGQVTCVDDYLEFKCDVVIISPATQKDKEVMKRKSEKYKIPKE